MRLRITSRFRQRGLGFSGMLVILAIAAIAAYYVWKGVGGEDAPQSCGAVQNACIANCRKTATEAPAMQACQDDCRRNFAACSSR